MYYIIMSQKGDCDEEFNENAAYNQYCDINCVSAIIPKTLIG